MNYTHVVLSSGGLSGLCYLGILRHLERMDTIQHVAGTSIGAVFAFLFALKVPMLEVLSCAENMLVDTPELLGLSVANFFKFPETFGMLSCEFIMTMCRNLCRLKTGKDDISFRDLSQKTGISLYVTATELHSRTCHFFSVDNSPTASVLECIRASISIPFIFPPVRISDPSCEGCLYVDGFLLENFPIRAFSDSHGHKNVFGAYIRGTTTKPNKNQNEENAKMDVFKYIHMVFATVTRNPTSIQQLRKSVDDLLLITDAPISLLPLDLQNMKYDITAQRLRESYQYGYELMDKKMKSKFQTTQATQLNHIQPQATTSNPQPSQK